MICSLLMMTVLLHAQTSNFETATEAVQHMRVGWNLGNTLDAHKIGVSNVTESETLRGQPVTKSELMEMMKMAGFNAIRIPVTWYPHMDASGNIHAAWMNRVKEVVDYVLKQDMYCIINIHHDTGKTGGADTNKAWLRATMANYNKNKTVFENMWRQIATTFRNYDQRLVFEGFNEMLDTLDSWRYPSWKAEGEYDAQIAQSGYNAINSYNRSFVQTVRATGGNNAYRNLIIAPYAACDARIPGGHNPDPFEQLSMPENSNHIIIGIHSYPSIAAKPSEGGALRPVEDYMAEVENTMTFAEQYFIQRYNAPVIIGEWGTLNVDENPNDYFAHRPEMFEFVDYFVNKAKEHNMATFFWMGLSNQDARALPYFNQGDLAECILKAYYGSDYRPMILTTSDYETTGYDVTFTKQYAELNLATNSSDLKTNYRGIEVELESAPNISGNLSFRAYPSTANNNGYSNYSNITSTQNTLNFSSATQNPIQRVTIVWRSDTGTPNIKIKAVRLIRKNGTKVTQTPTNKNACTINPINTPKFVTSKVGSTKYASLYYGNENLVVPPYTTARSYRVENGNLVEVKAYNEGDIIPKGTGVILQTTESTVYKFALSAATGQAATGSMMRGSDTEQLTTGGDRYYKLSLNANHDENSVGFYYGAEGGQAFINGAHKAYLAVTKGQTMAVSYPFNDINGIITIDTDDNSIPQKHSLYWYTLDGRRLDRQPVVKGIYVHLGKKVVVK